MKAEYPIIFNVLSTSNSSESGSASTREYNGHYRVLVRSKNILTGALQRAPDYSEACDCAPTRTVRQADAEKAGGEKAKHHFNLIRLYHPNTGTPAELTRIV